MAVECGVCGKKSKAHFTTATGIDVCCRTCYNAVVAEAFLLRMEERRERDEPLNKRQFDDARELSAFLSLYKHGNAEAKKQGANGINAWIRIVGSEFVQPT